MIMLRRSVNNNTRMALVISLCSNSNHLISLISPTATNFRHLLGCGTIEEVQSAYWDNSEQVTLHSAVFYYKCNDGSQEVHNKRLNGSQCIYVAFIKEVIIH